jgi:PAS domain S-box-containing protein
MTWFILLAGILAPAVGSVVAASLFLLTGWVDDFWLTWRMRFLTNAFATLTITPLILLTVTGKMPVLHNVPRRRVAELALLVAALFAVGIPVFGMEKAGPGSSPSLIYAPLPFLLWAAVRFGMRALSVSLLIVALLSLANAAAGRGPFVMNTPAENVFQLEFYLLAISIPLICVTSVLQERRQAVAALAQSEQEARSQLAQLSAIYRAAPTGLAFIDTELRYVSINDHLAEMNHLPAAAHIGRTLRQVLGDEVANEIEPLYRRVIETGQPIVDKEIQRRPSVGREATEVRLVSYHPVMNAQGDLLGVSAVIQEITARKRAEETLRNIAAGVSAKTGETFFQSLVEHISSALQMEYAFVCEVCEGRERARTIASYVNGKAVENMDYDLAGTPCEQVLRLGMAAFPQKVQQSFPEDEMLVEIAAESYLGVCLKDSSGKPLGLLAVLSRKPLINVEATQSMLSIFAARASAELERKQAEDRLRAREQDLRMSEERYREVVESQTDLVCRYLPDGTLTFANGAYCRFFRYPREKIIGRKFFDFVPEENRAVAIEYLAMLNKERRPLTVEHEVILPDGNIGWQHWADYPVVGPDGKVTEFQGIGRDITDRKRAEEANLKLAHATRLAMVGELTAMVVHELSQPLSAMQCNVRAAELMLENSNSPPLKDLHEILGDLQRDNRRASESVRRMRTLLRQRRLELKPLDLSELVAEVLQIASREAARRRVQIKTEGDGEFPPVKGDRVHLQQVLLNVVLNGMDAMANTPESKRCLRVRMGESDHEIEVAVTDAGQGIPLDRLPHIFDPFFTTKEQGLGLGLSISKWIIEAHRGRIRAENNVNGGATFRFTLPTNNVHTAQAITAMLSD